MKLRHAIDSSLLVLSVCALLGACSAGGSGGDPVSGGEDPGQDSVSPLITNITVQVDGAGGALLTWETDEAAASEVDYGPTSSYVSKAGDPSSLITSHAVALSGLGLNSNYHFLITSVDASGNTSRSGDQTFFSGNSTDSTPPVISAVQVSADGFGNALVTWNTDEAATSRVDYGSTIAYGGRVEDTSFVTAHSLVLSGLPLETTSHFSITSADVVTNSNSTQNDTFYSGDPADTSPPAITNIQVTVDEGSATITWSTNEPAVSSLDYGTTTAYGTTINQPNGYVAEHSVTLSGLTLNATYHFRITCSDAAGNQSRTGDNTFLSGTAPDSTPPVISEVRVLINEVGGALLTWNTNEPATSVVDYGLTASYGEQVVQSGFVTSHSTILSGLVLGTTYHVRISCADEASNVSSTGDHVFYSGPAPDAAPPAITNVQVTVDNLGGATVMWTTNEPATSRVDYGPTPAYGSNVEDAGLVTFHALNLTGLPLGQVYHFQVTSVDGTGNSSSTADDTFNTGNDVTPPTITNVLVAVDNAGGATVTWSTDEPATSRIDYGLTSTYGSMQSASGLVTAHTMSLSGLALQQTYHFRLTSADGGGNQTSTPDSTFSSGSDTVPPVITNVQVVVDNLGGATVSWDTDEPATSRVDYGLTAAYGSFQAGAGSVTSHAINLVGLTLDETYHFQITSADGEGNSASTPDSTFYSGDDGGPEGVLQVDPMTVFMATGMEGTPLVPGGQDYILTNTGTVELAWTASADQPWVLLAKTSGALLAGGQDTVAMTLDQALVQALPAGVYGATVSFTDISNLETVERDITLNIQPMSGGGVGVLTVTPDQSFISSGVVGGMFNPKNKVYTLSNEGNGSLDWTASVDQPWLSVSSSSGQLAPGAHTNITVSIDQSAAAGLGEGTYGGTLTVDDTSNSVQFQRPAVLNVQPPGSGTQVSSISQGGITWTFDGPYEAGQFANGDWWVVGPVTIVDISPPSQKIGGRTKNGSMVNPSPRRGLKQGYDSAMYDIYQSPGDYNPALNVALDVSSANPAVISTNSSLVSTRSINQAGARPQLAAAAILTVLGAPAPSGSFRPAYCGEVKQIRFNSDQLDYSLLARLPKVSSTPSMASVERKFALPWLDHVENWPGRYIHPAENMPDYGREIVEEVSYGALMLHLDFTNQEKETLLIRYVQLGIDLFGIVEDGGDDVWAPNGGHASGRKWPILFAGLMLGDGPMSAIGGRKEINFGEDDQAFYVAETSPGVINFGYGGYTANDIGKPEWGIRHDIDPSGDRKGWLADPYRACCTANVWYGELLAARIMGVQSLWDEDALFDYQDRYLQTCRNMNLAPFQIAFSQFPLDMWDTYRSQF